MNFNQYCTDGVALYDDFAQMVADSLEDAIRNRNHITPVSCAAPS